MIVRSCGSLSSGALKPPDFTDDEPLADAELKAAPPAPNAACPAMLFNRDRRLIIVNVLVS
jgi:hypothetical protein